MSSGVEGNGVVAAAVVLPVAAAYGAGWLAWQGGKLLIEANRAVDRQIAEKKRQLEEAARHRKMAALSAHNQLVDMCSQIITQLEVQSTSGRIAGLAEIEQLKYELSAICQEKIPDDVEQIESITSMGYLKIEKVIRQKNEITSMTMDNTDTGLYRGLSVADLMDDIKLVVQAMAIQETKGGNVIAANPDALERKKLNEELSSVAGLIMGALEKVEDLSNIYGLTASGQAWFKSCFSGVDVQIESLCRPTTTNAELKKGISRLKEVIDKYEMMAPSIEKDMKKMEALYKVYVDAAKALGKSVEAIKTFKDASELERRLHYLKTRAEKAKECAEVYKKLGPSAYMCYAWDQELKAMGYEVHTRKEISEMSNAKPLHARIGESKLPFYQWKDDDLTQLYSISEQCDLQVVVHYDGSVSMQTIAERKDSKVIQTQKSHCEQLRVLHEKLRENWFIFYDFEETESPEVITTVTEWRMSEDNAWKTSDASLITDQRGKEQAVENTKRMQ